MVIRNQNGIKNFNLVYMDAESLLTKIKTYDFYENIGVILESGLTLGNMMKEEGKDHYLYERTKNRQDKR